MKGKGQPDYRERIFSLPAVMHGQPVVKGTRIPAALILGYLATGETPEIIMAEYPGLAAEDIKACLAFAASLPEFGVYAF
jgi:uncharacterized protein (DUF433 family)